MSALISVIVSTYNWPQALALVLDSLTNQSDVNFEIVVADDGSRRETGDLIAQKAAAAPVPIKHYYQPDQGFRPARARNGGVSLSRGEYIVFVDGDCCVMPNFVAAHRKLMERGWFVSGKRCFLRQPISNRIIRKRRAHYRWSAGQWFFLALCGASTRPFQFLPVPIPRGHRYILPEQWDGVQTCNLGVWRDDFLVVDGFDATYSGYGLEDSDFVVRLMRAGILRKRGDYTSPVLHFYHARPGHKKTPNHQRFSALLGDTTRIKAVSGYSATLDTPDS